LPITETFFSEAGIYKRILTDDITLFHVYCGFMLTGKGGFTAFAFFAFAK
jgi:hypothetical protein